MSAPTMTVNPVLRRELVERWRGRRATWVVTAYVLLLAAVTLLLYWVGREFIEQQMRWGGGGAFASGPMMGRFLFENLLAFVLLLVLFIAPGYAAAQISGERERRTLALLQITLVRPVQIVAGKLGASLAWVLLLIVASLPFAATAFFLGGVAVGDLLRGVATILVVAVSVAAVGIGVSSMTRKTTASVVLTYAIVLVLLIGTLFGALVEAAVRRVDGGGGWRPVSFIANPYYGLADAVGASASTGSQLPSVLTPFALALPQRDIVFMDEPMIAEEFARGGALPGVGRGIAAPDEERPAQTMWLQVLAVHLALGAGGFVFAASRVRVGKGPTRKDRKGDRRDAPATPDLADAPPPAVPTDIPPPPPPSTTPPAG
jgi:ABC-2 type transport system permease protein